MQRMNGMLVCRFPSCTRCAASAEAATVHLDCFELFLRECQLKDALQQLWIFAAWRIVWREASVLGLDEFPAAVNSSVAESLGLQELKSLPLEILTMIRNYSAASLLWRFNSVLALAHQSPAAVPAGLLSIPLCELSAWERGGLLIPATSLHTHNNRFTWY
ncbi:hypothetical protein MGN70_003216 [Eutypa lata]|nr:hypothetical protein MGN70_003216 [Eutypa lata]